MGEEGSACPESLVADAGQSQGVAPSPPPHECSQLASEMKKEVCNTALRFPGCT